MAKHYNSNQEFIMNRNSISISISTRASNSVDPIRYADVFGIEAGIAGARFNPAKFDPLLFHLPKVLWAVFGTVTWRLGSGRYDSKRANWFRAYDFNGVLFRTCSILGLRVKNLGIYWTTEFGVFGEGHIHFLVAKDGLKQVTPKKFAQDFSHLWSKEFRPFHRFGDWAGFVNPGVGKAEVEPYNPAYGQRGVAYCLKREPDDYGRDRERYDYLSKKLFSIIL